MPREPATGRDPVPQHVWEYSFSERDRNRYVSRSLGYVVLLNGAAALTLMARKNSHKNRSQFLT